MTVKDGRRFKTGLIEGFYGSPWTWKNRFEIVDFLRRFKFGNYIYAPKSDSKLREKWEELWTDTEFEQIKDFREKCRSSEIEFGIGLSPYELYFKWDEKGKEILKNKVMQINELNPEILWILFDDMKGDRSNMADVQVEITHFISSLSTADKIAMCPTYYSFDPILKALFGDMPDNYLEIIADKLEQTIDIIWTGPLVCSKEITANHLRTVGKLLKRKPLIWDNYPVNDSPRMTPFLYLKGFSNRARDIQDLSSGHIINPMVQPCLTRLPLATLQDLYSDKNYDSEKSWNLHAKELLGDEEYRILKEDVDIFGSRGVGPGDDPGLLEEWKSRIEGAEHFDSLSEKERKQLVRDREEFDLIMSNSLTDKEKKLLINKYSKFNSSYFKEIVDWLKGKYSFDPNILNN